MTPPTPTLTLESARAQLRRLGFYGLLAQAETLLAEPWLARVLDIEDTERARRSLKRRLDNARLGAFKPHRRLRLGLAHQVRPQRSSRSCSRSPSSPRPPTWC